MTKSVKEGRKTRNSVVLIVAGEGGHLEQARRLSALITPDNKRLASCVLLTDHGRNNDDTFDQIISVPTCAPKHREVKLTDVFSYTVGCVKAIFRLQRKNKIKTVIVTGPGFALFPALAFRILGAKLIVFESWSRFEDKSKCGKALYPFAHHFLVQHEQLLKLYPKAVWVGLL